MMHMHELRGAALDETALVILSETEVLMGPLNLYDIYVHVAKMRDQAGLGSLARR